MPSYDCPVCGHRFTMSDESLAAAQNRIFCPHCVTSLQVIGDYAYVPRDGMDLTAPRASQPSRPVRDPLYDRAVAYLACCNAITPVMLRDALGIDIERAQALMAQLERNGVVGPYRNGAPRQILIPHQEGLPFAAGMRSVGDGIGDTNDKSDPSAPQQRIVNVNCGGCLMLTIIIAFVVTMLHALL